MSRQNGWTPIQKAIIDMLSDGRPHLRDKIHKECLGPSSKSTVSVHICMIRKKLPPGHDIVAVSLRRRTHYQHVRLLADPNDGRT